MPINDQMLSSLNNCGAYLWTSSQTWRFRCFQILQNVDANSRLYSIDKVSNNRKIVSVAEVVEDKECWITPQRPVICQTWTTKGQLKNTWARSSWCDGHEFVGDWTPLSRRRTRVWRQPRHIRHTRFLTLGGTWSFQMPDQ